MRKKRARLALSSGSTSYRCSSLQIPTQKSLALYSGVRNLVNDFEIFKVSSASAYFDSIFRRATVCAARCSLIVSNRVQCSIGLMFYAYES